MSKAQKSLDRLLKIPPPSDFTWSELKGILERKGYIELNGSGSRRKFFNKTLNSLIILHEPHPGNIVKAVYLKQVIEELRSVGLL